MGRGGIVGYKRNTRRRVPSEDKGSDESDEDYTMGEDEGCDETDEYCSSFGGDESEESLEDFEEEEEEEEKKVKSVVRSRKAGKDSMGRKTNRVKKPQKKRRVSYKEEDADDYDDDDDDDEEFTPDDMDCIDDEDELSVTKKKKRVGRPRLREKSVAKGRKGKGNSKVQKKPVNKKPRKNPRLRRKSSSGNDIGNYLVLQEKSKRISGQRRRLRTNSDSDFVSSRSSDYEYTISEEEREQVREASEFCRSLTTCLRSSSLSKRLPEEGALCQQRKFPVGKGKEKVEELKNELGKQVCGICFSEEGKKTVRGTLNCCSHYFCFACIMAWSKVESRCPLCKQRFVTISKPARSSTGFDLRTVVIQVPELDQVYQPSEEELRGYLDPYESVICTECHQGGDDALMLLCDICDSPAHTYCVGLGHEVPEGNWYCEGCRPTALGSSNPQCLNATPDQRTNNIATGSSPIHNLRSGLDLNLMYVPDTPSNQGTGFSPSPRRPTGDIRPASPPSGSGASTVSERRRIQRQIQNFLSNRMSHMGGRMNGMPATNFGSSYFGSQFNWGRETALQHAMAPERLASCDMLFEGRLQDNAMPLVPQNRDLFPARSNHSRGQGIQNPASTSVGGMLRAELGGVNFGINSRLGYGQLQPCSSRSSIGSDVSASPFACREVSHFNVEKEQVQTMVRRHLKSLSREMELGHSIFNDIATCSTHTILVTCGLEHQQSEVHPVELPQVCNHIEGMTVGQKSLMKGYCYSCFDSFVGNVVRKIMNTKVSHSFGARD